MQDRDDHPHVVSRNARYGLILFAIYIVLYGGFVFLAVFRTPMMDTVLPGGVNLAIAYGFALIVSALVLAIVYLFLCGRPASHPASHAQGPNPASTEAGAR